jgi:hypothetical protein
MDPTEPVWEIFIMLILLLIGVIYCIVYIMQYDDKHDDHSISTSTTEPNGSVEHELGGGDSVPPDADVPVLVEEENRPELREEASEDDGSQSQNSGGIKDGSDETTKSEELL